MRGTARVLFRPVLRHVRCKHTSQSQPHRDRSSPERGSDALGLVCAHEAGHLLLGEGLHDGYAGVLEFMNIENCGACMHLNIMSAL